MLMNSIRDWQRWPDWQRALGYWLLAVIYIFLAGWLGISLLPTLIGWGKGIPEQLQFTTPTLSTLFIRWDSGYYLTIAQQGYSPNGTERAYFPLYPLLARWLSTASGLSVGLSGLVISLVAFATATVNLYAWVRCDHSQATALWATLLLCFSPVAFYLVAFYPESLFLALSIFSLYCARRGWFLVSGIAIALAGAARPTAFLLGIGYILEVLLQRPRSVRTWAMAIAGALLAPLGAFAYFTYLGRPGGIAAGLAAYSALLKAEWDTKYAWPWTLIFDATAAVVRGIGISPDWFSRAYTFHDMLFALGGLSLSLWSVRYMRLSLGALLLASVLYICILHGPGGYAFDSAPRRLMVVAPIYLALALWVSRIAPRHRWIIVAISTLWLGILAAWFTSGRWVS
jgi:Gpi18-like mannosyltransferase